MGCCSDCWQWFVELVLRDELTDADTYQPPNSKDGENPVDLPEIEKLTRVDEPYRQDRMRQLFNRHGYNLAIFPGGHVRGNQVMTM